MNSILDKFKGVWGDDTFGVSPPPKGEYLTRLRQNQEKIEARACQDIRFAQPLLTLGDIGVIYPNTIIVIQGQKGEIGRAHV